MSLIQRERQVAALGIIRIAGASAYRIAKRFPNMSDREKAIVFMGLLNVRVIRGLAIGIAPEVMQIMSIHGMFNPAPKTAYHPWGIALTNNPNKGNLNNGA